MKWLGETSPFHWFTNPRRDKSDGVVIYYKLAQIIFNRILLI